jgi:O-antigen ligase
MTIGTVRPPGQDGATDGRTTDGPATDGGTTEARLRAIGGTALLLVAVGAGVLFGDPVTVGAVVALVALLYLFRSVVFAWPGAAVALVIVIALVPARRYTLPVSLPFAAEPYRLIVLLLLALVVGALLLDPRFRWRRLEFGGPVAVFVATQLVSIGTNIPGLVGKGLAPDAVIALLSMLVVAVVFVVARQLLQSRRIVRIVITATVLCGALVGALAAVERVTRENLFLRLFTALPLHRLSEEESVFVKEGTARAFGSAQHPIALAVFLCMLIPLGIYLARHAGWPRRPAARELLWLGATLLIVLGMIAAVSRTALVSIVVMVLLAVVLRPALLPKTVFYGLLTIGAALLVSARNVLAMVNELLDPEALIESQMTSPGWTGSGRLADLGPSLDQAAVSPFVGTGLGSRVTIGEHANAFILDNQYLSTLLESGILGVLGVAVMMLVPLARLAAFSRRGPDPLELEESGEPAERRDLALALAVSIAGYAVALFFFDGFSFIQTLLAFFLLLALGSWAVAGERPSRRAERLLRHRREAVPT